MYYCALSLGVLQHIYSPYFLSLVRFGVFWSTVSVNFLLRKYYNYLNNIDIWHCFGLAICTGASSNTILDYNLVRFGVCMIKLRHERMLILRCILKLKLLEKYQPSPHPAIKERKISIYKKTKKQHSS